MGGAVNRSCRRRERHLLVLMLLASVLASLIMVRNDAAAQGESADPVPAVEILQPAAALAPAVRGARYAIAPEPPPPVLYPTGACDRIADGLPGLNGPQPERIDTIGTSVRGRTIWAEYWGPEDASEVIVVVGQIHGNECSPTLLIDALRRRPTSRVGVWLIPTLNPDGHAAYTRRNANDVDLNADGGAVSQPETRALMTFLERVRPSLTVHVHSPNGFAGAYPANADSSAGPICRAIAVQTPIRCSGTGAGVRTDRSTWFLWQGHARFTTESLLIELHAVSDLEVPTARPRPPTRTVQSVLADARAIAALLLP